MVRRLMRLLALCAGLMVAPAGSALAAGDHIGLFPAEIDGKS
jgi:hypothetical protein